MTVRSALAACALLLGSCASSQPAAVEDAAIENAAIENAVVHLRLESCKVNRLKRATGVVINDGLIVTVAHSFDESAAVSVENASGDVLEADLIYLDGERDLAVLRLSSGSGTPPEGLSLANKHDEDYDETVRYVGFQDRGLLEIHDATILRYARVTLDGVGDRAGLELQAEIETGDSGGPVLDDNGDIIGLVFASAKGSNSGWAIAVEEVQEAVNQATAAQATGRTDTLPLTCD